METMRAVYIVAEEGDYAQWMKQFWAGKCAPDDPLYELMYPLDLRGEVTAWGETPHWTILDVLTTSHPNDFDEVVRSVCKITSDLTIEPRELDMWGNGVMMKCDSPSSESLRTVLAASTRHLIARFPVTDEEFQRGEWWIARICGNESRNLSLLRDLKKYYQAVGSPSVPSSRHFRLGFLMHLYRSHRNAVEQGNADLSTRTQAALNCFLRFGEPSWYHQPYKSHSTIVSGVHVDDSKRAEMLFHFRETIQPLAIERLGQIYKPGYLAIMGEDPETTIDMII